jgi:hypothetical protein
MFPILEIKLFYIEWADNTMAGLPIGIYIFRTDENMQC